MGVNKENKDKPIECNVNSTPPAAPRKTPKKITKTYLHNAGLAYLQRFPASTMHFDRVMMRKIKRSCNYHKDQCLETCRQLLKESIENFCRMGLLNDDLYLKGMVTSLRRRGLSRQAILAKLQMKGFSSTPVLEAIKGLDDMHNPDADYDHDLTAAAICARKKRLGPYRRNRENDPIKELATLGRAGFSYDIAQRILKMDVDSANALLQRTDF